MACGPEFYGIAVGDLATWVGAAMSFAAVVTALGLATRESRRKARDADDLERVFAPGIADELIQLRWSCGQIAMIHKSGSDPVRAYRGMVAHLESCRCPTLDLVASRDAYRGDRGRALMTLYAALLRLATDLPRYDHENDQLIVVFSKDMVARTAADLFEKAGAALTAIWVIGPTPDKAIPDWNEPPGFRPALVT